MPDAWDDDWIAKGESASPDPAPETIKISKAERRKQQAEFNRQIWERENTEKPEDNFFLQTKGVVPMKTEFKPAMKVLSRKPVKPSGGIGGLSLGDDDDDEDEAAKDTITAEERMQKAQKDREEKRTVYEERRRQLFGKDEPSSAQTSKPLTKAGSPRNQSRVKGGGNESRPSSAASNNKTRQLYDPNESSAKPEALRMKKEFGANEIQPIREPRAPDGSGRGGFGFSPRGGRTT